MMEKREQHAETPPNLPDVDTSRPSVARMYDYFLGGFHNFEVDRQAAEFVLQVAPQARIAAVANRTFLQRAVRFMVAQGIEQFLDLGSGIPTVGNVHEVAQAINPEARVVYVDIDPVAVAHGREILGGNENATVIQADARDVEAILNHPDAQQLIDFSKPIGILAVAFFHFIEDESVRRILDTLRQISVSGSYLAISHASDDETIVTNDELREMRDRVQAIYAQSPTPLIFRKKHEIESMFDGWSLVEPGLVFVPLWRPESENDFGLENPQLIGSFAGVGVKP